MYTLKILLIFIVSAFDIIEASNDSDDVNCNSSRAHKGDTSDKDISRYNEDVYYHQGYDTLNQIETIDFLSQWGTQEGNAPLLHPEFTDTMSEIHPNYSCGHQRASREIGDASSSSRSSQRIFPCRSWQRGLGRSKLTKLYDGLTSSWPIDLERDIRGKWEMLLSKWLDGNREILDNLLKDDKDAWNLAIHCWKPEEIMKRSRNIDPESKRPRQSHNCLVTAAWLAGKIHSNEKDVILSRLTSYWHGVHKAALQSRLANYTKMNGRIHSPEALLGNDENAFKYAADLIYLESNKRGVRHPDSSPHDALHQSSNKYGIMDSHGQPVYIPYGTNLARSNAERYNSNHTWLKELSRDEIDYYHEMIGRHYSERVKPSMRLRNCMFTNEYLENNPESLRLLSDQKEMIMRLGRLQKKLYQIRNICNIPKNILICNEIE